MNFFNGGNDVKNVKTVMVIIITKTSNVIMMVRRNKSLNYVITKDANGYKNTDRVQSVETDNMHCTDLAVRRI